MILHESHNLFRLFPGSFCVLLFLGCLIVNLTLGQIEVVPQVQTEEGSLRGTLLKSRDGRDFYAFRGIPYVETPKRFELAEEKKPWEGVRDATRFGSECPQVLPGVMGGMVGVMGKEDCLFINVFTPKIAISAGEEARKKLPVMVWHHGGAFVMQSAKDFGPNYLMDQDIVLVTFNYRLGPLGFLYNEDDQIPGNLGLKDQVAALRWVQRNIKHFSGNENEVTIFGESAGSASVHYMILSPMATGLFKRAIMMSGVANSPWALSPLPKLHTRRFAAALECPVENSKAMIDCLRTMKMEILVDAQLETFWGPIWSYHWAPVVEKGNFSSKNPPFLTKHPEELIAKKEIANKVPLIIGLVKNEGAFIFSNMVLEDVDAVRDLNMNWSFSAPLAFLYFDEKSLSTFTPTEEINRASHKIREFYFGNMHIGYETEQRLTDLFSDRYFIYDTQKFAHAYSEVAPVYPYLNTFFDGYSVLHVLGYTHFAPPTHTDDLQFLFSYYLRPALKTENEFIFSKEFVRLWVSFATHGKPNETWGAVREWPVLRSTDPSINWYQLDRNTQIINDPFLYRIKFWDNLHQNELKNVIKR